jgi:transposase
MLRKKRQKLVKLVLDCGHSIGQASKKLKIKLSTAKMIVKRFRTDGTFFETRKQKLERLHN